MKLIRWYLLFLLPITTSRRRNNFHYPCYTDEETGGEWLWGPHLLSFLSLLPAGRLNFSMHNGALCWPSGISNSALKWCCWEFKAPQPALSKPPPNWNQQTPTGLHQCYIMSRKSEVFKGLSSEAPQIVYMLAANCCDAVSGRVPPHQDPPRRRNSTLQSCLRCLVHKIWSTPTLDKDKIEKLGTILYNWCHWVNGGSWLCRKHFSPFPPYSTPV